MRASVWLVLDLLLVLGRVPWLLGLQLPLLGPQAAYNASQLDELRYLPFSALIEASQDTSEFWRETEILSLVTSHAAALQTEPARCRAAAATAPLVRFPSRRTVRPICRGAVELLPAQHPPPRPTCVCRRARPPRRPCPARARCPCRPPQLRRDRPRHKNRKHAPDGAPPATLPDRQLCPQCPHFSNYSECELFRDSCKERAVAPAERAQYCDRQYGRWRAVLVPADYSQCRCCDQCVFYRELDQSCMEDEYSFDAEEFLPVTSIDFRAGCNPYWGHPEQEMRALRCDNTLRRCVPVSAPSVPKESRAARRSFRYEAPTREDCPVSCRGYTCKNDLVPESGCRAGAFLPDKSSCNCCGRCSPFQQLNEKCAEIKRTVHDANGTKEVEVEEEFLEPGCDDGLVCRGGRCQDIHAVRAAAATRRKRDRSSLLAHEPCKRELRLLKKKFGPEGHLHYDAPQCTPLWLYAPVQCRRFVCYCALEDGSLIQGIKVPRVEVSNMNCDCAREKCRTNSAVECDGYGNYREAMFTARAGSERPAAPPPPASAAPPPVAPQPPPGGESNVTSTTPAAAPAARAAPAP